MLNKILRTISGTEKAPDWESMFTQLGGDSEIFRQSDVMRGESPLKEPAPSDAPDMNLALLGLSGAEVNSRAKEIAKRLHNMAKNGATVQEWNQLIRAVTTLSDMGQTLNSLAEIKLHKVRPKVVQTDILPIVGGILAKRANDLRRAGVLLEPKLSNYTIEADPQLCKALVETAIEWILPFGNRLTVTTELSPWGDAGKLIVCADHVVRTQDGDQMPAMERTNIFLWQLIGEVADAAGVLTNRSQGDGKTLIAIDFPIKSDDTALDSSFQVSMQTRNAPSLSQLHIVVFARDAQLRFSSEKVLSKLECKTRYANTLPNLVRECETIMPNVLIVQSDCMDENAHSLVHDLRRHVRQFLLIELVAQPNVYDVSLPGANSSCRLSASNVESHLKEALMFELAQLGL